MVSGHTISLVEGTASDWVQVWERDLDPALVASTVAAAISSHRLRAHAVLAADGEWSRTFIALTSASYVPPHLHPVSADARSSCERLVSVRGRCAALLFGPSGEFDVVYLVPESASAAVIREGATNGCDAGSLRSVKGIEIHSGVAHSLIALDDIAWVCESKRTADVSSQRKVFLPQFPVEGDSAVPATLQAWRRKIVAAQTL